MNPTGMISQEELKKRIAPGGKWSEIIALVDDLPPLPMVARKAMVLADDPTTDIGQLSDVLGKDAALASRVLRVANSAAYSCERAITTISQAILIIGFTTLKGIIVSSALRQMTRKSSEAEAIVWKNSYCTAVSANLIARQLKRRYLDEAFLMGLLHDMGKLAMLRQITDKYQLVFDTAMAGYSFVEIELEQLGFAHTLIGALIAKKWNFPPETCHVLLRHHDDLSGEPKNMAEELTYIVQASDLVAHHLGMGHLGEDADCEEETMSALTKLGITGNDAERLLENVLLKYEEDTAG